MTDLNVKIPDFLAKHGITTVRDNTEGKRLHVGKELAFWFAEEVHNELCKNPELLNKKENGNGD